MTNVLVLNGPNLNRLGTREPEIYGTANLEDLRAAMAESSDAVIDLRQTNDEAELIGWLHEAIDTRSAVILNPAAFTHYSYALRDAAAMVTGAGLPLVEVHISNPHAREEFRHHSYIADVAVVHVVGEGVAGYATAVERLISVITGQAEG